LGLQKKNEEEQGENGEQVVDNKENKDPNHKDAAMGELNASVDADMIGSGHLSPIACLVAMVGDM
jgi:hypothetical protein